MEPNAMSETPAPLFTDSDVVGAIQRMMMELSGYLNQPTSAIDPNPVQQMIQRMSYFTSLLGSPDAANGLAHGGEAGGSEAHIN